MFGGIEKAATDAGAGICDHTIKTAKAANGLNDKIGHGVAIANVGDVNEQSVSMRWC
jgi:hypothetical protein